MSGKWNSSPAPIRPGVYLNTETVGTTGAQPGLFGTVGMPIKATWGPIDEFVTIRSEADLTAAYGYDVGDSATSTAWMVREALLGGASEVKVLRISGGSGAGEADAATLAITNTTPATALTLTAKYAGTRGNGFTVIVRTSPTDGSLRQLCISEAGVILETWTYAPTDIADLATQINHVSLGSSLVTAVANITGVALTATAGTLMAGGSQGDALVSGDYSAAQDLFARDRGFDVFCLDGNDNGAIGTALNVWTSAQNDAGNYVMSVIGGPTGETVANAVIRTTAYASEYMVSLGGGDVTHTLPDGTEETRTTAQMVARVAGMIAASGVTSSITRGAVPNIALVTPLTGTEVETCIENGVVCFTRSGTNVIVEDGVTSYSVFTDAKDQTFGTISNVRAIQRIGMDLNQILETSWLGKKRNTVNTRQTLVARVQEYFQTLEAMDVLVNGTVVEIDTRYDSTGFQVYLLINAQFSYELKKVLITLRAPTIS